MSAPVADTLISLIQKFPRTRIAVIGDLMIDEFIYGSAGRISPEAPVPVVNVIEKKIPAWRCRQCAAQHPHAQGGRISLRHCGR